MINRDSYQDPKVLMEQLTELMVNINEQIDVIETEAFRRGISPMAVKNSDGSYAMNVLMQIKAQTILSIIMLQRAH